MRQRSANRSSNRMSALVEWAERSHPVVLRARERFDVLEDAAG